MKKNLFGMICAAAFTILTFNIMDYESEPFNLSNETDGYRESGNSEDNMALARSIAAMTAAKRVAVIGNDDGILIGIALKSGTGGRSVLRENAEKMAKSYYPDSKILVEIQTEKAEKIFNLASYLEKGIPEEVLLSRIGYLLENN